MRSSKSGSFARDDSGHVAVAFDAFSGGDGAQIEGERGGTADCLLRAAHDHAGGDRAVGSRVNEDEAAGFAALHVGIEGQRLGGLDRDAQDVVEMRAACL